MKEMMIPYILIVWSLFATGALKKTIKNYTWAAIGGAVILGLLAIVSRLWAPVDMTNSSTVKAPHAVMSPIFGQQIDKVFVDHNQMVKKATSSTHSLISTLPQTKRRSNLQSCRKKKRSNR